MLTPAERDEGRRLLAKANSKTFELGETYKPLDDWLREHAEVLINTDIEAVRQFAVATDNMLSSMVDERMRLISESDTADEKVEHETACCAFREARIMFTELAAERGVNLDDKPDNKQPQGEEGR